MEPNADKNGVVFGVETDVPVVGGIRHRKKPTIRRLARVQCLSQGQNVPAVPQL